MSGLLTSSTRTRQSREQFLDFNQGTYTLDPQAVPRRVTILGSKCVLLFQYLPVPSLGSSQSLPLSEWNRLKRTTYQCISTKNIRNNGKFLSSGVWLPTVA